MLSEHVVGSPTTAIFVSGGNHGRSVPCALRSSRPCNKESTFVQNYKQDSRESIVFIFVIRHWVEISRFYQSTSWLEFHAFRVKMKPLTKGRILPNRALLPKRDPPSISKIECKKIIGLRYAKEMQKDNSIYSSCLEWSIFRIGESNPAHVRTRLRGTYVTDTPIRIWLL
jgi:hypothetical protein